MKRFFVVVLLFAAFSPAGYSQCMTAFRDTRDTREDFFYIFYNSMLNQQEYQRIQSFEVGPKMVAYVDFSSEFKVFQNGQTIKLQDFAPVEYHVTDHLLVYKNAGDEMYAFDGQKVHSLGRLNPDFLRYAYGDSVVAFNDYMNSFVLFFNGKVRTYDNRLVTLFGASENIVVFVATNYEYNIFYNGEVITLETGAAPQSFQVHNNVVAYVDFVGDFKLFYNGEVMTLQRTPPVSYKVGEDMVAYINLENKFMVNYAGNDYELMPIPPKKYEIQDNVLVYFDQYNDMYAFVKGETYKLAAYEPLSYMIDRNIVVFTDLDRRLSGLINGKVTQVSEEPVDQYYLNNSAVLFQKVQSTMRVSCDGVITLLY